VVKGKGEKRKRKRFFFPPDGTTRHRDRHKDRERGKEGRKAFPLIKEAVFHFLGLLFGLFVGRDSEKKRRMRCLDSFSVSWLVVLKALLLPLFLVLLDRDQHLWSKEERKGEKGLTLCRDVWL